MRQEKMLWLWSCATIVVSVALISGVMNSAVIRLADLVEGPVLLATIYVARQWKRPALWSMVPLGIDVVVMWWVYPQQGPEIGEYLVFAMMINSAAAVGLLGASLLRKTA